MSPSTEPEPAGAATEPPPEPLRRRLRARALEAITGAAGWLPDPALDASLRGMAGLGRRSRFGELTRTQLAAALGEELSPGRLDEIEAGVFRHVARQVREWIRLARGAAALTDAGRAFIERKVLFDESLERLEAERRAGRGMLIATAHIGNWELLAAALRHLGLDGAVVGKRKPRDRSADWLVNMRASYGVVTLPQDAPPRQILGVLRGGGTVGILCDLDVRRLDGEFLPFLGRPALTMTAPAALARAARLPVLPVRCTAIDEERYLLRVEEPIALDRARDKREAARALLTELNRTFERWIREDPEQWAWHQPRWRTRPPEEDG